jgi:hypothetical protein
MSGKSIAGRGILSVNVVRKTVDISPRHVWWRTGLWCIPCCDRIPRVEDTILIMTGISKCIWSGISNVPDSEIPPLSRLLTRDKISKSRVSSLVCTVCSLWEQKVSLQYRQAKDITE